MTSPIKAVWRTRIFFGSGMISRLKEIVEEDFKDASLFLVTDKGIREAGIADKVLSHFPVLFCILLGEILIAKDFSVGYG